jgi:hypothetical protein
MPNICSQCEYGYVLKADLSQCLISNNNMNQNATTLNSQNNFPSGSISSNSQNKFTENFVSNFTNNSINETNSLNSNNSSNKRHSNKTFYLKNENIAFNPILNNSNNNIQISENLSLANNLSLNQPSEPISSNLSVQRKPIKLNSPFLFDNNNFTNGESLTSNSSVPKTSNDISVSAPLVNGSNASFLSNNIVKNINNNANFSFESNETLALEGSDNNNLGSFSSNISTKNKILNLLSSNNNNLAHEFIKNSNKTSISMNNNLTLGNQNNK